MKKIRKVLATVLSLVLLMSVLPLVSENKSVSAADEFVIISPAANKLIGAGHFDVKWTNASETVSTYEVYMDGKLQGSTQSNSYDCYTTKVSAHTAYVVAKFRNGTKVTTPTVTFYVTKKGLCVNDEMGKNLSPVQMNMGWYYCWGVNPFSYKKYKDVDFVPMIWGAGGEGNISNIANAGYKYLLAYNEPDMGWDKGGCNMDVSVAVNNWPQFTAYDSYFLGAPAPAYSPSWGNGTWLRTFMESVDTNTIDFIPLHCYYGTYGGKAGAEDFLKNVVDATWEMYHKPIWITEFAVSGWGYSNEWARESLDEFVKTAIDGLNEREYVERYSWFSFNTTDEANGASALWTNATGELTELGKTYAEYGNPEGYIAPAEVQDPYKVTISKRTSLLSNSITIKGITCKDYVNEAGVLATASSSQGNATPDKVIDGDITSRWESKHGVDPQSLVIDLGQVRNIKQVGIVWEAANAKEYAIEVSTNGTDYKTVATVESNDGSQNRYDTVVLNNMAQARYVRINGISRNTQYGYSIYDIALYGTNNVAVDETTAPETTKEPDKPQGTTKPVEIPSDDNTENSTDDNTEISTDDNTEFVPPVTKDNPITTTQREKKTVAPTVKPGTTKVKTAVKKKASKKVKLSLKRVKKATGYQVKVSTTKKFKKKKTVTKYVKKVKITIKNKKFKNKKKVYVKARAYTRVKGKKQYGAWSKIKKVHIRK